MWNGKKISMNSKEIEKIAVLSSFPAGLTLLVFYYVFTNDIRYLYNSLIGLPFLIVYVYIRLRYGFMSNLLKYKK